MTDGSNAPFVVVPLNGGHDRDGFTCGVEALDRYLRTQATQDVRRRVAACFVAVERATGTLAGFYTLAASSIALPDLPADIAKKLPRYPLIPAVRMRRLAIGMPYRGVGPGAALLADALERAARAEIMAFAMIVDAKDETAARFYEHHGFARTKNEPLCLFLSLARVKARAQTSGKE